MTRPRVIVALSILDGGLVKTRQFAKPKYLGDPMNAVRIFSEKGADEILLTDIGASRNGRPPNWDLLGDIAGEALVPLGYCGGLRTAADGERVLYLGFEKVGFNSATEGGFDEVRRLADAVGSQSVTVSVDVKRNWRGERVAFRSAQKSGGDVASHVKTAVAAGAGEILLTAVDREGTWSGFDVDMVRKVRAIMPAQLVVNGGASSVDDIGAGLRAGADAVAASSMFIYRPHTDAMMLSYPSDAALEAQYP